MKYKYLSDTVEVKTIEEKDNKGVFHIEGLYTGYGITLANSLRRSLLSSIPGAAISKVKIKGVKHEFSTVPGMKEDVVEFSLNLKKVSFNFMADEPQVIKLKKKGEGDVTAGDIKSSTLVEVVNPDVHIATLTDKKAELDIEITVEKGLGYVPAEERKSDERLPIGTIVLDCIFSPVKNVSFNVENMRVGERTNYNRIELTIETDSSISPSDALRKAGSILQDHYRKVVEAFKSEEELAEEKEEKEKEEDKDKDKEKDKKDKKKKK